MSIDPSIEQNLDDERFGVFHGGERICRLNEQVPDPYLDKYVIVKFKSGLMLDCLGANVQRFSEGRI